MSQFALFSRITKWVRLRSFRPPGHRGFGGNLAVVSRTISGSDGKDSFRVFPSLRIARIEVKAYEGKSRRLKTMTGPKLRSRLMLLALLALAGSTLRRKPTPAFTTSTRPMDAARPNPSMLVQGRDGNIYGATTSRTKQTAPPRITTGVRRSPYTKLVSGTMNMPHCESLAGLVEGLSITRCETSFQRNFQPNLAAIFETISDRLCGNKKLRSVEPLLS